MELVYLWVEDYKNICKQGFNFSPRFECKYNVTNNELTIEENKDYINIFPKDVNITAIVGKNGSGKSSVLEIISYLFLKEKNMRTIILILLKNNITVILTNTNEKIIINYSKNFKIEKIENINNYDLFSIFYSPNFTNGYLNKILELFSTPIIISHEEELFGETHLDANSNFFRNQSLLNFVFNSSRIIDVHPSNAPVSQHGFNIKKFYNNFETSKIILVMDFLYKFGKKFLPLKIQENDILSVKIKSNKIREGKYSNNFLDKVKILLEPNQEQNNIDLIDKKKYRQNLETIESLLNKEPELRVDEEFTLNIDNGIKFINAYLELFKHSRNLKSIFDFKFKNLSSGEENLILMFALLENGINSYINQIEERNESNFLLMLDEMENNFHPQWQKKILANIIKFTKLIIRHWNEKYKKSLNFNIILTTHSPFLISDLPKQNIIFLDTYKEEDEEVKNGLQKVGNCKVLSKDDVLEKKQTFGANIHTLLSDNFFMSDGLMGEFAKSKIEEVNNFYDFILRAKKIIKKNNIQKRLEKLYLKKKEYFWQIQEIIGEPFLQKIIKNQLEEIETILFDERAKEIAIKRFITEFGEEAIGKVINNGKD